MAKVNIYVPDDLLRQIDRIAEEQGRSRSSIVQEAAAGYVAHTLTDDERATRRASIMQAIHEMQELSAEAECADRYPDVPLSEMLVEARRSGHHAWTESMVESVRRRHGGR